MIYVQTIKNNLGPQQLESEWLATYAPRPSLLQTCFVMIVHSLLSTGTYIRVYISH